MKPLSLLLLLCFSCVLMPVMPAVQNLSVTVAENTMMPCHSSQADTQQTANMSIFCDHCVHACLMLPASWSMATEPLSVVYRVKQSLLPVQPVPFVLYRPPIV